MKAVIISAGIEISFLSFIAHTELLHVLTLLHTSRVEKCLVQLKRVSFLLRILVFLHCYCVNVLFVLTCLGVQINRNVMLVLKLVRNWKVWSSALNRIDHRAEK